MARHLGTRLAILLDMIYWAGVSFSAGFMGATLLSRGTARLGTAFQVAERAQEEGAEVTTTPGVEPDEGDCGTGAGRAARTAMLAGFGLALVLVVASQIASRRHDPTASY